MMSLFLSTIVTSAADSLNPFAILQQFVLQGLVKKPRDIWYFIVPTGVTNLIGGFLVYYGLAAFLEAVVQRLITHHSFALFVAELIVGIAFLIGGGLLVQNRQIKELKKALSPEGQNEGRKAARKIHAVSPAALIAMGVGSTISELTTAVPYFTFLAILLNYELTLPQVSLILLLYNVIYTLPLVILYMIYRKAQSRFDQLYGLIQEKMSKWSGIITPLVITAAGTILIYHSLGLLLK